MWPRTPGLNCTGTSTNTSAMYFGHHGNGNGNAASWGPASYEADSVEGGASWDYIYSARGNGVQNTSTPLALGDGADDSGCQG